jgi:hypothetical protein
VTIFLDTSSVGGPGPLTATGQVFSWGGVETKFYIGAVSNIIPGQSTGPSVQFVIQSRTDGQSSFQVDYATQFPPRAFSGHLISAVVPSGTVSLHIVIADDPQEVVASLIGTATSSQGAIVQSTVTVNTTKTAIVTNSGNFKWRLMKLTAENNGTTTKIALWVGNPAKANFEDWITPPAGTSFAGADITVGAGPGNSIALVQEVFMAPGDVLYGEAVTLATVVDYQFLEQPL